MSTRMAEWSALAAAVLAPLGWALVLLAERIWPGTASAPYLAAVGAAALVVALALHGPNFQQERLGRAAAGWLAAPYGLFVLALAFYYGGRTLPVQVGAPVDWTALATGGWVLSGIAGAVLYVFLTLARLAQRHTPQPDPRRLRAAGGAGLSLALLVLLVLLLNFVFDRLPWQWNLAYFRTTQPSEATLEVARGLAEPVQVQAFFQADSSVSPFIEGYFQALAAAGTPQLKVQFGDAYLQPALAEEFQARGNGWVVLRKGDLVRPLFIGDSFDRARIVLRIFDRTFFTKLVELSRPRQVVYLTVGHGERAERGEVSTSAASFANFRTLLADRNYTVKELGVAEGLAERVPQDAALVVVSAPTQPLPPAEAESLKTYLAGGGRLLVFLEPETRRRDTGPALPGQSAEDLLRGYGVEFEPVVQANDRTYARRTYTLADHALLVTVQYLSHESVSTLQRSAGQYPLLLLGAGALRAGKAPDGLVVRPTIRGMPGTWGDVDGDFQFSAGREQRGQPTLAMAVGALPAASEAEAAKQPAIVVFADADLAGDLLLRNRANQIAVQDALGWLVVADAPVGLPTTEEDVPIRHAKDDEWLWFYLPVLGVPALALGGGMLLVRRRGRGRGGDHA